MRALTITALVAAGAGCTGIPEGIEPVSGFSADRYLGTWYEIARYDHSFEEGLENVTAEYELNSDGSLKVINRGYSPEDGEWQEAEGKARFVEDEDKAHLKVSFFGPFYASYVVFGLDHDQYQYAYVTGYDRDYLWFLARTPTVSEQAMEDFRETARANGFDLDELIIVEQSRNE
ncbi:MAG: lipocalin family protein [Pseudomonadota bacterium]